jgi:hypothetical protein
MSFHGLLHDGQADPNSLRLAPQFRTSAVKLLKHA